MFKQPDSITPILFSNFGAGSIITNSIHMWVVVGIVDKVVGLINLQTMRLNATIEVLDANYLTEEETRALVSKSNLPGCFSDFSYIPKGLKDTAFIFTELGL